MVSSTEFVQSGSPWDKVRNISLSGGPSFDLRGSSGRQTSISKFNDALIGMLQRYQKLGTAKIQKEGIGYQEEQARRLGAETEEGRRTFSPEQQRTARYAGTDAMSPSISGAGERTQTVQEQIVGLGNVLEQARSYSSDLSGQANAQIQDMFSVGGAQAFANISPEDIKDLENIAGLPVGSISSMAQGLAQNEARKYASSGGGGEGAKTKYTIKEYEVNGKLMRDYIDPYTSEVVKRENLSGEMTTDKVMREVNALKAAKADLKDIEAHIISRGYDPLDPMFRDALRPEGFFQRWSSPRYHAFD